MTSFRGTHGKYCSAVITFDAISGNGKEKERLLCIVVAAAGKISTLKINARTCLHNKDKRLKLRSSEKQTKTTVLHMNLNVGFEGLKAKAAAVGKKTRECQIYCLFNKRHLKPCNFCFFYSCAENCYSQISPLSAPSFNLLTSGKHRCKFQGISRYFTCTHAADHNVDFAIGLDEPEHAAIPGGKIYGKNCARQTSRQLSPVILILIPCY